MSKKLLLPSIVIWLVPFVVSFFFYDRSAQLVVNFLLFKIIMVIVLAATCYFALKNYYRTHKKENWVTNSAWIIGVQVLLDLIVLILVLKMNLWFYLYSVVSVYLVVISGVNYWLSEKK